MNTDIKIATTNKQLSAFGGLHLFAQCWSRLNFAGQILGFLPTVAKNLKKFEDLVMGLAAGIQCLDDMSKMSKDQGFQALCDEQVYTPKTYGNFLRQFTGNQIDEGNKVLAQSAFNQRASVAPHKKSMILDFDSTSNRQYAEKMEGVCFSGEKKYDCLTTMYVFDELGIQYYSDVRSGNTHTSDSISKIIHMVMSQMPNEDIYATKEIRLPWARRPHKKGFRVYGRADAGYCNSEFMNACSAKNIGFVVRMRADMLEPKIKNIRNWKPTKKKQRKVNCRGGGTRLIDTSIRFYDGRTAEIGTTLYRNENMVDTCRVVCIRAKKLGRLGLREDDYDYFSWLTNIGEHEKGNEAIIFLYRGRGNAENFIKEMKNGYELHNYPCLKLNANRAYALAAAFAHNVLRFLSWKKNGQKAQFAKAIRHQLITLPCQVIRTGRQVFFKFSNLIATEVKRFLATVKHQQNWLTNDFESGAAPDAL